MLEKHCGVVNKEPLLYETFPCSHGVNRKIIPLERWTFRCCRTRERLKVWVGDAQKLQVFRVKASTEQLHES